MSSQPKKERKKKGQYYELPSFSFQESEGATSTQNIEDNHDIDEKSMKTEEESHLLEKEALLYTKIRERIIQVKNTVIDATVCRVSLLAIVLCLFLANYFFLLCNETCPIAIDEYCFDSFARPHSTKWAILVSITSLIFVSITLLSLYYRKIHLMSGFITFANVVYLVFFYNPVLTSRNYGQVVGFMLALEFFSMLMVFFIIRAFFKISTKAKIITTAVLIIMISVFLHNFYTERMVGACDNWIYGLGRDQIDNTVGCQLELPVKDECTYDILEGIIDLSVFTQSCPNAPTNTKLMKKYYGKATSLNLMGLPRVERAPYEVRKNMSRLSSWIYENSVALTGYDDPKAKDLEMFVDTTIDGKARLEIKIKRNETLVKERAKLENEKGLASNVLVIFLDTISRARMHKKLPKTTAWFEKYYGFEKSTERESFEFFKFHSIAPFTKNNLWAAYGDAFLPAYPPPQSDLPEQPREMFGKTYIENGYLTSRISGYCDVSMLYIAEPLRAYLREAVFDHEGSAIACDPHYTDPQSSFEIFTGAYSFVKRCLYGRDFYQHMFDYGNQFWRAYPNEKKLLMMEFQEGHEGTQEVIKYNDDTMANFLENLERDKLLNDTAIVLFGDHGLHISMFPYNYYLRTFEIERALPVLFLTLPKRTANNYREQLTENKQKLVSAFQLYEFFMAIPEGKDSPHTYMGLFGKLPNITCKDFFVAMQPCVCNYKKTI